MIKLYIYCSVLIIGNVEVGPDIGMKFHQEVIEIVSYDNMQRAIFYCIAYKYAKRYKHMQGDIFYCIAYRYAKTYMIKYVV